MALLPFSKGITFNAAISRANDASPALILVLITTHLDAKALSPQLRDADP